KDSRARISELEANSDARLQEERANVILPMVKESQELIERAKKELEEALKKCASEKELEAQTHKEAMSQKEQEYTELSTLLFAAEAQLSSTTPHINSLKEEL